MLRLAVIGPQVGFDVIKFKVFFMFDIADFILFLVETFDEEGNKIFFNQFVTFVVGSGGFRGKRSSDVLKVRFF